MQNLSHVQHLPDGSTVTLHNQDCIRGMRQRLDTGSVDVIVTSPPYNLGINYAEYDDTLSREYYLAWLDEWAAEAKRVLADDGSLFLNVGGKPTDPLVPFQVLDVMCSHFTLQNCIHWIKSIAILKSEMGNCDGVESDIIAGHFKPIPGPRFINDCHEYIFHLTKKGDTPLDRLAVGVPYQDKSNIQRYNNDSEDLRCRGNTWFIPYDTIQKRDKDRPHPATFPIELPRRCIKLHGLDRVNLVLDPFMGIGTTALVCAELQIPFVGFEISPVYFDEASNRLKSIICQPAA